MINKQLKILTIILIALELLIPVLNIGLPSVKATDTASSWSTMSPMPTARGGVGLAVVNGKIYAIGGLNGNNVPVSTTEEYDPQTNGWISKMPMPTPRSGFAIAVYQNKIYVIGGSVGNGYVGNNEVYDTISNTWETKTSMPTPRADLCANIENDSIYLIGGKRYSNTAPYFNETNINEAYNPANDSWSTKTPVPKPVQGYASAVADGKIYVMGGSLESLSLENTLLTGANQVYDPQNDNWSFSANLPTVQSYGAAATTEGFMAPQRIYCIGGYSGGEFSSQVQVYDLKNNSWTSGEPMPTARAYLGVVDVDDVLYAIGGFDGVNWLNVNEQYKPVGYGTVPPKVQITSPENKTYSEVTLGFAINRGTQWMGYSLDDHSNITIQGETKLFNLSQGVHEVTVYANDSLGNMGVSNSVFFTVDTLPPSLEIGLPQNKTYDTVDIQLTFAVNEAVTYLAYSLDGQENVKINGNLTLPALSNGPHRLTLYATDTVGNTGQKTVFFNIEPFPVVVVVAVLAIVIIVLASVYLVFKRKKLSDDKDVKV
jgi:N-acetylneuraminic acid mutarotase